MLVTISSIDAAGPSLKARRLVFDGDEPPRMTSASVVKELRLEPGATLDREHLETQLQAAERPHAWDRSLRILGYRDRTSKEVRAGLAAHGYPTDITDVVIDRLLELGLLDDCRFASSWVRTRTAAGYGPRRIARELAEKGVSEEIRSMALSETDSLGSVEMARRALHGRTAPPGKERERLVRRLLSRGFSLDVALLAASPEGDTEADEV